MKRNTMVVVVGIAVAVGACSGTTSFGAGATAPSGWGFGLGYNHAGQESQTLTLKGPADTENGCVVGKDASGDIIGGGKLIDGCATVTFPTPPAVVCVTIPDDGDCPPRVERASAPQMDGSGWESDLESTHAGSVGSAGLLREYEIIELSGAPEADLSSAGDIKHVRVTARSTDDAHAIVAPYLADPLGVPKPPQVEIVEIRLLEAWNATPGLDVVELRSSERDHFEVEVNQSWLGSLENGLVQQTYSKELGGVFLTAISIPTSALDLVTPLDPETRNDVEWSESYLGSGDILTGSAWVETH